MNIYNIYIYTVYSIGTAQDLDGKPIDRCKCSGLEPIIMGINNTEPLRHLLYRTTTMWSVPHKSQWAPIPPQRTQKANPVVRGGWPMVAALVPNIDIPWT